MYPVTSPLKVRHRFLVAFSAVTAVEAIAPPVLVPLGVDGVVAYVRADQIFPAVVAIVTVLREQPGAATGERGTPGAVQHQRHVCLHLRLEVMVLVEGFAHQHLAFAHQLVAKFRVVEGLDDHADDQEVKNRLREAGE